MKRKLIIDTDGGGDDAIALLLGLSASVDQHLVELVAITTCWGNVSLNQVLINIAKLMDFFDAPEIPIYRGADRPMMGEKEVVEWDGHGKDGFGDADFPVSRRTICTDTHAAVALVNLLNSRKDDEMYQVVTLAPLTNIALAIKLDPTIVRHLRPDPETGLPGLVVMGGAIEGKGNSSMIAEFNIHSDPEAAYIVFQAMNETRFSLVSWEVSLTCPMPWTWFDQWVGKHLPEHKRTRVQVFIDKVLGAYQRLYRKEATDSDECVVCDAVAMAVALHPEFVVSRLTTHATIELGGRECRGAVVLDWYGYHKQRPRNADVITRVDTVTFLEALTRIVLCHTSAEHKLTSEA
eukprot:TRINITY_DN56657_c0_g1_i1.p1 TRINITY_DN56657_c0_g1~~TRINITY_DN56657_c0_g1_i1.p1  ORF type:complete len:360 (-),score=55.82 TRINITY_DN56657_c0_g1_i1:2-1048(-)